MKLYNRLTSFSIFIVLALVLIGWVSSDITSNRRSEKNITVLLKFKAQPEKGERAVSEFVKLLDKVKKEPHFVAIKLHVDPEDNTNILLYETWEDQAYYTTEHMNTTHLQAFMEDSKNFLTGPPDVSFWKVENVFKK